MHHEYVNYLFGMIEDWEGIDDFGLSFSQVDLDDFVFDVDDSAPEDLRDASQQHVARVLGDHFGARHLILHWSYTGARTVHAMPSHRHATEAYASLLADFEDWLELAEDLA